MDLFDTALTDEAELRALYEMPPSDIVARQQIDHLDEHCRRYLALCPFALVASADAEGRVDVTPRGGPPWFIFVRSGLWDPASWPEPGEMPSPAAMLRDHVGDPAFTLEQAEQALVESVTIRLA